MKLYDAAWAPSPRRVRIFLAEKGVAIPRVTIDLRRDEQLGADYLAVNPQGTLPALVLDDGTLIADSVAICRYVEALHPAPRLFGANPAGIARVEEWTRIVEQRGYAAAVYALRNTAPHFADRALAGKWPAVPQLPALVDRARILWAGFVDLLDARLADSEWVAGDAYSFADIMALTTIDFARAGRLVVPEGAAHVARWHVAAAARPSAAA